MHVAVVGGGLFIELPLRMLDSEQIEIFAVLPFRDVF